MTARPEERDRPYETAEETDEMNAKETDTIDANPTDTTDAKETDETDTKETDATDAINAKEMDALTIPLATNNDLQGLPPSARRQWWCHIDRQ